MPRKTGFFCCNCHTVDSIISAVFIRVGNSDFVASSRFGKSEKHLILRKKILGKKKIFFLENSVFWFYSLFIAFFNQKVLSISSAFLPLHFPAD